MAQKTFTDNDTKIVISGIIDAIWEKVLLRATNQKTSTMMSLKL